ncbi:MAG: ABC transporter ATP-binding protein [Clostridium sp.]
MKKPVIEFKDFSVHYMVQESPTLKNINLTIYEGEKVLIVGPSGSGKSTLAHAINGLIPFSYEGDIKGSLKINGKETRDLSVFEISNMVGTVLQDPDSQFIGLTVSEDIAFKLENNCVPKEEMEKIVSRVSKIVDINSHLKTPPHALSGGQKQRVTLAGTIVDDVNILLFDEPLASLDPMSGKNSMELIDEIQNTENKTIIIIEHRLEEVLHRNVDRIILINEGEIVMDGTPDEVLSTEVLKECGIREPLYISALKYAGCEITKACEPSSINTIKISDFKDKLKKWDESNIETVNEECTEDGLEFKNVIFGYSKENLNLNDVTFKINKGEMVSIVGKNGAGKSTLSKLICGFYSPNSGDILYNGKSMKGLTIKERAEKIGFVMQNPNQMISKTMIFDEVALGLRVRGVSEEEIKDKVYKTLKICGLYPYRNWPISALSYGQRKRVTIASILVLNPEVIILDEPTAGQDFKHYNEIMEFLKELNKKGITIIMVTHDMHLMLEYTNRTIVLADGKIQGIGTPSEILTNEELILKANLKETSLYQLAIRCKIENPLGFVKKFIDFDRRARA